ncbi:MAG: type III pantothenate kinase [Elusimicrobiales bacterium]
MLLALDVGNSQIYGAVFEGEKPLCEFRKTSKLPVSADELGLFLRSVLRENSVNPQEVREVAVASVVPDLAYTIRHCCEKYFGARPFTLGPGVKTGLNVKYKNPAEVGADRIANAVAVTHLYPGKNAVVIDFGTATTFCAVSKTRDYLGGVILPGLRTAMEALAEKTAKLFPVEIVRPPELVGRTTASSIQSGLYYGNLAVIREFSREMKAGCFGGENAIVIATGGFSHLFEQENVFDALVPDLVLTGLRLAYEMNRGDKNEDRNA